MNENTNILSGEDEDDDSDLMAAYEASVVDVDSEVVDSESVSVAEILRLRELKANLERMVEIKKLNGLALYLPHEGQEKFHLANKPRRYLRTGNRFGKSTCGAAEDVSWCLGERIFYPVGDPRRYIGIPERAVKGVLIVNDWDKAAEIFTSQEDGPGRGKLFQLIPQACNPRVEKSKGGDICKILMESKWGGTSVLFIDTVKSFMANPGGHESSDWDFVHVDEPCPQAMWAAYSRGLIDRGGWAWFCCTPITEQWINDYFIPRGRTRSDFAEGNTFEKFDSKYRNMWVLTGNTRDNPHNTTESIQNFIDDVPADELESRLAGKPRALSGMIHKDFNREVHLYSACPYGWKAPTVPPKTWTIRAAIDPHPKIPTAVLFSATGPLGHTYFWSEIFSPLYIEPICDMMKSALYENTIDALELSTTVCDPLAWTPNPITGVTMADTFCANGIIVQPGSKELMHGILQTGQLLRRRDADGNPLLQFHESLHEFLYEIDRYVWDPKKESPHKDCPDHLVECLHRLVLVGLNWIDPTPSKPVKMKDPVRQDFDVPRYESYDIVRPKRRHEMDGYSERIPLHEHRN